MIVSFIPILAVDVLGSVVMVVIALLCLYKARILREMDPADAVFLYLLWISTGFTIFAAGPKSGQGIDHRWRGLRGLGLSVGYGIIRRHGGDITARNREKKGLPLPSVFHWCRLIWYQPMTRYKEDPV